MEESGLKLECPCGNVGEFSTFLKYHIDNIDVFKENICIQREF